MLTFQDFEKDNDKKGFVLKAINEHILSPACVWARRADCYDRQMNETVYNYVQMIYSASGDEVEDFTAANNKIASNFFNRLNTQRCTYSLGNGVDFTNNKERIKQNGKWITVDKTKKTLGKAFDTDFKKAGYLALIHGVSFCFWNIDKLYVFPLTEFVPLWDEYEGTLRAGIRFWRLAPDKPLIAVLYEEDGYTRFQSKETGSSERLDIVELKKKYKTIYERTATDTEDVVIGEENYSKLPIVPFWGNRLHQSTLVGMQRAIDSFDLIRSGFANDLTDCAQIYWIIENYGGMNDAELAQFRDRMKLTHIVNADTSQGGAIKPYTQEIPFEARKQYLEHIRSGIYEDFGGLDVHTISATATNDHIDAAYQPLDENADDFEFQAIECIQQILELIGIDDTPIFKRNRISNQLEQVQMVVQEAQWLDTETILSKLPNISNDEIQNILQATEIDDMNRMIGVEEMEINEE